jgi:hypothetical protein
VPQELPLRDPQEYLQDKHNWLMAADDEKEDLRQITGVKFTEMDRLPGFFGPTQSPIDGMHMFDLNMSATIFKDILLEAGMFNARFTGQTLEETPLGLLNHGLHGLYLPFECSRIIDDVSYILMIIIRIANSII